MGILSWFRSRWPTEDLADDLDDDRPSLIRRNPTDDPKLDEIRLAAAADVARVEHDDKHFGQNAPANQDEGL
jgi:hypothetical protein